jgi:ABC-type phosphate transport system substrate-binding protein
MQALMKMTNLKRWAVLSVMLFTTVKLYALDAVVIANDSVSVTQLSPAALKAIYTGKTMYWEGGQGISLVVAEGPSEVVLQEASGMGSTQFRTHWQRLAFSGRGQPPKKVDDVQKAVALVKATRGAIAILPAGTDIKGVRKLEVK